VIADYWRWWTGELSGLVPERIAALSGFTRSSPVVALRDEAIVLLEPRAGSVVEVSQAPLASLDPEGRRLAVRNLLSGAGEARGRVRLCIAPEEALVRRVSLPLATAEDLAQVLAFEMDRLTPFRAQDVHFGYRIAARDAAAGKVHVDLAVARREAIDPKIARLREWGAQVVGVVCAPDLARQAQPIDLMPEAERGARARDGGDTARLAAGIAVVALLVVALLLPIWQKRETVIALLPVVDKARQEAEAAAALSRDLERLVAEHNFLLAKKHTTQPVLAILEDVSRLLPDHTWVQQLDVRPAGKVREVQIAGETTSSSKLIEILEQSSALQNAATRGTVTRGSQPGTERFLIAAEARARPLPEAIALSAAASLPSAPATPVPAVKPAKAAP
jgi:general secretion pathway protein L